MKNKALFIIGSIAVVGTAYYFYRNVYYKQNSVEENSVQTDQTNNEDSVLGSVLNPSNLLQVTEKAISEVKSSVKGIYQKAEDAYNTEKGVIMDKIASPDSVYSKMTQTKSIVGLLGGPVVWAVENAVSTDSKQKEKNDKATSTNYLDLFKSTLSNTASKVKSTVSSLINNTKDTTVSSNYSAVNYTPAQGTDVLMCVANPTSSSSSIKSSSSVSKSVTSTTNTTKTSSTKKTTELPPLTTSNAKVKAEDRVGAGGVVRRSTKQRTGGNGSGYA